MAIITTYVCDVSGVFGEQKDFVKVTISGDKLINGYYTRKTIEKIVHIDVANKLGLIKSESKQEEQPEPTLESKLLTLLKDYISDIAYEAGAEAASNQGG